jgi:hypothetical protein
VASAVAVAVAIGGAEPEPASAARDIPVAGAGVNDQNLKNANWRYAIRFVVDEDTSMYRFMSGFKALGANGVFASQGTGTYGRGDGGLVRAQLVTVKADGTPNMANVLGNETVTAQQRYAETKSQYGVTGVTQFWHFNMGGVQLKRDTMYAMVYSNASSDPANNYFSTNSPTMKESEVGPNGRNNLDPNAPGAVGGLDAREAVAWSTDAGSSWVWGRLVGQGYYVGSATSDDGTRLPWYAWQQSAAARPQANQPYYQYFTRCTGCKLLLTGSPRAVTLTQAGGYAPVGSNVGVVTVRNLRTWQTGRTGSLGSGVKRGPLDTPVRIEVGDSYEVSTSGTVYKNPADGFIQSVMRVGTAAFPFTTPGFGNDRAELFATPHPWFAPAGVPAPAPAPTPAPTPVPTPVPPAPTTASYADGVLQTGGLTGYWRLGESSGTVAYPARGTVRGTFSGVSLGQAGLLTGDSNLASVFSGSSTGAFGDVNDFTGAARFSIEAWVKPNLIDGTSRRILAKEGSGGNGWLLYHNSTKLSFARLRSGVYQPVSTAPLKVGQRSHIVVAYDGASLRLYVNGTLAVTTASTQQILDNSASMTLGRSFSGTIDEVAVYGGTALSGSQVSAHYAKG